MKQTIATITIILIMMSTGMFAAGFAGGLDADSGDDLQFNVSNKTEDSLKDYGNNTTTPTPVDDAVKNHTPEWIWNRSIPELPGEDIVEDVVREYALHITNLAMWLGFTAFNVGVALGGATPSWVPVWLVRWLVGVHSIGVIVSLAGAYIYATAKTHSNRSMRRLEARPTGVAGGTHTSSILPSGAIITFRQCTGYSTDTQRLLSPRPSLAGSLRTKSGARTPRRPPTISQSVNWAMSSA